MPPILPKFLQNRRAVVVAVALLCNLLVLPWLLWTPPPDLTLKQAIWTHDPSVVNAWGEWFLLHLIGGIAALSWWAKCRERLTDPVDASRYGSHGSARLAYPRELRSYLKATGPGLILGRQGDGDLILPPDPMLPYNQHVTVIGSSGSRKTRSFVQPNLLQEVILSQSSVLVCDPKGENYARSADLLRKSGCEVRLLNFLEMAHSDRWNPLAAVTSTTDVADLSNNLVANTVNPNRPRSGDPFWDQAEQSFITALVLYVKTHCPPAEQHMASVLELGAELHPNNLDRIFLTLPRESLARRFYRTFLRAEEKVRAGVVAGIGSRLQLWNIPEVVALTAASDVDLADLGRRRIALFLVIPDSKTTYAPILALLWQQAFQELYRVADENGGTLPVPVRCVMDEIANCGYIPDYAQKKSTMRSRRVSTEEIWQNLSQIKNRYPSTWPELIANADHLLFLGTNDFDTSQYISQLTGTTTITVEGRGNSDSLTGGSTSSNLTYIGRPLLTPDECRRLPTGEALLFPKGHYPARIQKVDYAEYPIAAQINLADPRTYQPPKRQPVQITDVEALLAANIPPRNVATETPTTDPSQFIDDDASD